MRAHAQRLAVTPEFVPTLYGPVVLTGATEHGEPAPFTDTFGHWFATILDQIDRTAARIQAHGRRRDDPLPVRAAPCSPTPR